MCETSKGKAFGDTFENQEVIECFVKARLPDQSFVKQLLDILQTKWLTSEMCVNMKWPSE